MSAWLDQVFAAGQANRGGVVRRSVATVRRNSSEAELIAEVKRRGFHVIKTGDQYVILCHQGRLDIRS